MQLAKDRYQSLKTRDIPWEIYLALVRGPALPTFISSVLITHHSLLFSEDLQRLNPEFSARNKAGFFALARGTMGIPGGFIQGKDEGALVALYPGRNTANAQTGSFGNGSLADKVKVSLYPFIIKVADLSDLQVDLHDLGSLVPGGIVEGDFQNTLGYRKLMHEKFFSLLSSFGFAP